jgi:2-(1,2-epoxy-1,2-dihydrophenyl)acetyl-CoA isomerase
MSLSIDEGADGVVSVQLDRPDRYNAINPTMRDALITVFDTAEGQGVRAIVIHGAGRGFCSGVDLADSTTNARGADVLTLMQRSTQPLVRSILNCGAPVVAAVHGVCAGIGMTLALGADICVAAEDASFQAAFVRRGVVADGGICSILPRLVGIARAKEFLLLGGKVSGVEAASMGMIARTAPPERTLDDARAVAADLAAMPTRTVTLTKALLDRSGDLDLESFLLAERAAQAIASTTDDMAEGIAAFREKRQPTFNGR